jgi:tRNA nucleotidyltransferase/poly(A) polymerase
MIFSLFRRKKTFNLPEKDRKLLDYQAIEIVRDLQRAGHQAYLVGGCVRDVLLGLKPKDFDIATSARPEEVKRRIKRSQIIGRRFRIVLARRNPRHSHHDPHPHQLFQSFDTNTVTEYQITTFRSDPVMEEGRLNENVYGNIKQDAFRRDFTFNALYLDPVSNTIWDYTGGFYDIQDRRLRVIGDPAARFQEDPIRIFRAIRMLYRTKSAWDKRTYRDLEKNLPELKRAKKERLREEILKSWREGACVSVLSFLLEKGIWSYLAPLYAHKWARDPQYHKLVFDLARGVDSHPWPQGRVATPFIFIMSYDYWMKHSVNDRSRFEELFQVLNVSKKERLELVRIASILRKLRQGNFENAKRFLSKVSPFLYHIHSQCFYLLHLLSDANVAGFEGSWKKVAEEWKTYQDKSRRILLHREKSHKT